jgi:hypothetical protein
MNDAVAFERCHDILIDASPGEVLDYVSNPNTWPEWIAASHHIESPDRPLVKGDGFRELWHTRTGESELIWTVTDSAPARLWVGEADTPFIGKIVVRYDVEVVDGQTRFTRTMINPARPKPPTQEMIDRMDEEAEVSLANIKRCVEARSQA